MSVNILISPATELFVQKLSQTSNQGTIKNLHYQTFVLIINL